MRKLLLVLASMGWLASSEAKAAESLQLHSGQIDLSNWSPDSPLDLHGEWHFFWNELLSPAEAVARLQSQDYRPSFAQDGTRFKAIAPDKITNDIGYATYVAVLRNVPQVPMSLGNLSAYTSARLYLFNAREAATSKELVEVGVLGNSAESSQPFVAMHGLANFQVLTGDDQYLVIQVSNFHHTWGGLWVPPKIAAFPTMFKERLSFQTGTYFILGLFIIIFLYNFSFYMRRREDKASLYLSLFVAAATVRTFVFAHWSIDSFDNPELSYEVNMKTTYLTMVLPGMIFLHFLRACFPRQTPAWLPKLGWGILLVPLLIVLFSSATFYGHVGDFLKVAAGILSFVLITVIVLAAKNREEGARISLFGAAFLMVGSFLDIAQSLGFESLPLNSTGMGLVVFAAFQSQIIAVRFASAFRRSEYLSRSLQNEVERATITLVAQKQRLEVQQVQLSQSNQELRVADELKTAFFRQVSHELRTPLTLILGSLAHGLKLNPTLDYLNTAEKNSRRLLRLVNQLLDFQRLQANTQQAQKALLDLSAIIRSVVESCHDTAHERGIELSYESSFAPEKMPWVMGQLDALEKIAYNYLSNALKYTPAGGKIVVLLSEQGFRVRLSVRDTGCGISAEDSQKLFQPFMRLEDADQKLREGTGIGLALVKELAETMHGRVGIDSQLGVGSSFWVEFPMVGPEVPSLDILIIDHEPEVHQLWQTQLREREPSLTLTFASTLEEFASILREKQIHLALVESHQTLLPTLQILQRIGQEQPFCSRLLVTSRDDSHHIIQEAINECGLQKVLHKPIGPDAVDVLYHELISKKLQQRPIIDLLYIDDEEQARARFISGLTSFTDVSNYRVASNAQMARAFLAQYRVRCIVSDINLGVGESGLDLLIHAANLQPQAMRIILSAERSLSVLEKALNEAQIHKVFYKPSQLAEDLPAIVAMMEKSSLRAGFTEVSIQAGSPTQASLQLADIDAKDERPTFTEDLSPKDDSVAHLLIVDDIPDLRRLIRSMLQGNSFRFSEARDGAEALAFLQNSKQARVDLLITDWMMPHMSGPELIAAMQADSQLRSIPTILLTAKTDSTSRFEATRLGASAYLGKPFDGIELQSTIHNLLELKQGEKRIMELNRYISENVLRRFLPPSVVSSILAGNSQLDAQPKMQSLTVLFCDMVGFTRRTEQLGPNKIATVLNSYLQAMTEIIYAHHGTIDKFMGDGIMVLFGAPENTSTQQQVSRAIACSEAVLDRLHQLNQTWLTDGLEAFAIRIGVHHGTAIVGSFGGPDRSDYTAIGSTVNIAARIQSLAPPNSLIFTESVRDYLGQKPYIDMGLRQLKGLDEPMHLYVLQDRSRSDAA